MRWLGDPGLLGYDADRACDNAAPAGQGATVSKSQDQIEESQNYILFPMAVGVLFLAFLVVGALLG